MTSIDPEDLKLSEADLLSPAWLKLSAFLKARLDHHRRKNDAEGLDATQTAALRGRIAELKIMLATGESRD